MNKHRQAGLVSAAVVAAVLFGAPGTRAAGDDPFVPYEPAATAARAAVASGQVVRPRVPQVTGNGVRAFTDLPSEGAVLIGFELSVSPSEDGEVATGIRPQFMTQHGVTTGRLRGQAPTVPKPVRGPRPPAGRTVTLKAARGFAVAGLTVRADTAVRRLTVRFARLAGRDVDPAQSYSTEWAGGPGGQEVTMDGLGAPAVGVFGTESAQGV